jgi:hypothetical protein
LCARYDDEPGETFHVNMHNKYNIMRIMSINI